MPAAPARRHPVAEGSPRGFLTRLCSFRQFDAVCFDGSRGDQTTDADSGTGKAHQGDAGRFTGWRRTRRAVAAAWTDAPRGPWRLSCRRRGTRFVGRRAGARGTPNSVSVARCLPAQSAGRFDAAGCRGRRTGPRCARYARSRCRRFSPPGRGRGTAIPAAARQAHPGPIGPRWESTRGATAIITRRAHRPGRRRPTGRQHQRHGILVGRRYSSETVHGTTTPQPAATLPAIGKRQATAHAVTPAAAATR
ncbi:hypothetical protein FBX98_13222 [Burkholderia sp. SJZ115]|nr:hypothetical protein FB600_13220 [Burkholderia sp. SJZ089]TWC94075.1 hypothetical protein FBX98_13222 [Burkholderia sp. SJZ115]TWC96249.1 hypothetical protein FB601_13222 [Burkholderia sp. SJZ091]